MITFIIRPNESEVNNLSDTEKKDLMNDLDEKFDRLPEKTLAWLDGFMTGTIKATAEQKNEQQKEGT